MHEPVPPTPIDPADLAALLDATSPHEVRVLAGLTAAELREHLALAPPSRPVLSLDLGAATTVEQAIANAIVQKARAVVGLWPYLWGGEDFSNLRDDALGAAHLPIRLAALGARLPGLSQPWAVEAVGRLLRGRSPLTPGLAPTLVWSQLALAFDPEGAIVAIDMPGDHAAARIAAVEWLARHADVSAIVLPGDWPLGPYASILYGARRVLRAPDLPADLPEKSELIEGAPAIVLPPAPEGRPHPLSPIEQKLYKLIQADDELRPLFAFNRTVPDIPLITARADLLWLAGRVVVEIDGPEHRAGSKFRADRRRDYELMCAGYRVMRMTNEDVEADATLAIEKIRRVARLAGTEAG